MIHRTKLSICLCTGAFLAPAFGQTPLEDIGFAPSTPLPDGDLIVVREKALAGPVDLTGYGLGTGADDYVQSIYFRFFVGNNNQSLAAVNGVVVFPDGTEILGFITDGDDLGGEVDDGVLSASDATFGVGVDPDAYSAFARGFEVGQGEEFVCKVQDNAFVFLLSITNGVDDFRVIVDYGDSFAPNVAFALDTFAAVSIGSGAPQAGIRLGDDTNPIVFGSGDYGEVGRLSPIPITSVNPPVGGPALPLVVRDQVYIVRDSSVTVIDGFQTFRRFPVPSRGQVASPGLPVGLTEGPDGLLYTLGQGNGFSVFDPVSRNTLTYTIEDRAGNNAALCDATSSRELFFARDTSGSTFVDRFDLDTFSFAPNPALEIPATVVGLPTGIEEAGGLLYVVGSGGGFVEIDPATGTLVDMPLSPPNGAYRGIVRGAGNDALFLVRETSGDTAVDRFELATGSTTYGWSTFPEPGTPVDLCAGPLGRLYVVGVGNTGPARLVALNGTTGDVEFFTDCLDFPGSNRGIAYPAASIGSTSCGPAVPNSSGASAWISLNGSRLAGGQPLEAAAWDLPPGQFGYFLTGMTPGFIANPGGSQGNLCLTGAIGRYVALVQSSGPLGQIRIAVDTLALPLSPPVAAGAGETWYFQCWFRDNNPGPTSNFTDAVGLPFQ
ncbi:MAG: hypothetical protein GY711_24290 [bacterium]|nr:hypothetical protein [bacterium]